MAVISLRNAAWRQAPEQKRFRLPEGASFRLAPHCWHERFQIGFGIRSPFAEMNAVEGQQWPSARRSIKNEKGRRPESQDETVWRARRLKASYALWPKHRDATRLPADTSGVFEIWEKWVGLLCKGTINSAISMIPPGVEMGLAGPT